jgi:hypothetical protein
MIYHDFTHRDGLDLFGITAVTTQLARKVDGRGCTANRSVLIGQAWCDPIRNGEPIPHIILAFPADIHHGIMTPDEADRVAKALTWEARLLRRLCEKHPGTYCYQTMRDE